MARRGPGHAGQPPFGRAQHRPRDPRSRAALSRRSLHQHGSDAIKLELDHVAIDVELFLHDVAAAGHAAPPAAPGEAAEQLRAAGAIYAGDFLEEDLYEDWAIPLRERARAAYSPPPARSPPTRKPPATARQRSLYLRILERDPLTRTRTWLS